MWREREGRKRERRGREQKPEKYKTYHFMRPQSNDDLR